MSSVITPNHFLETSAGFLAEQNEAVAYSLRALNFHTLPLTETPRQQEFIFTTDGDCIHCKHGDRIELTGNRPELQHIISPRAVTYSILSLVLTHGPEYLEDVMRYSFNTLDPTEISQHEEIPDDFFRWFLESLRCSILSPEDSFIPIPAEDSRVQEAINRYWYFIRLFTTDPRNVVRACKYHNDLYTPMRSKARTDYRYGWDEDGFRRMQNAHQTLAVIGQSNLLVHPYAEWMQMEAIARTTPELITQYQMLTDSWRMKLPASSTQHELMLFALTLNNGGYQSYRELTASTLREEICEILYYGGLDP